MHDLAAPDDPGPRVVGRGRRRQEREPGEREHRDHDEGAGTRPGQREGRDQRAIGGELLDGGHRQRQIVADPPLGSVSARRPAAARGGPRALTRPPPSCSGEAPCGPTPSLSSRRASSRSRSRSMRRMTSSVMSPAVAQADDLGPLAPPGPRGAGAGRPWSPPRCRSRRRPPAATRSGRRGTRRLAHASRGRVADPPVVASSSRRLERGLGRPRRAPRPPRLDLVPASSETPGAAMSRGSASPCPTTVTTITRRSGR